MRVVQAIGQMALDAPREPLALFDRGA